MLVSIIGTTTRDLYSCGISIEKSMRGNKLGFTNSVEKKLTTEIANWLAHKISRTPIKIKTPR
jgi:hypothetical protein